MKKILMALSMLIIGSSSFAMDREQRSLEDALLRGIERNNLLEVQGAVAAGAPVDEIKYLIGYKGESPITLALIKEEYNIADYLLSRGAPKSSLDQFLSGFASSGDVERVKWLLDRGAKDEDDKVLNEIKKYEADEPYKPLKAQYGKIIELLERIKHGPVRLIPTGRPAPAIAKPVAKQPIKLTPMTKPAAALPK